MVHSFHHKVTGTPDFVVLVEKDNISHANGSLLRAFGSDMCRSPLVRCL
jgi:hypothetical protein